MKLISPEIAQEIANNIPGSSARRITQLVDNMNNGKAMFRGIAKESTWARAINDCVAAKGPEGGGVSYWTSGARVFNANGDDHLQMYDTTFFHYAPGRKGASPRMYILATKDSRARKYFEADTMIMIPEQLERSQYDCLEVVGWPLASYSSIYLDMLTKLENFVG